MANDILVLSEQRDGQLDGITYELLSKGREIADNLEVRLAALLLGSNIGPVSKLLADCGVDTVLLADHPILQDYNAEVYRKVISDAVRDFKPSFFLLGYTYLGMEVGPAVATRLGVPIVSNCVDLGLSDGKATVTRPMFSGMVHAKIEIKQVEPYIISFQKGVLPKKEFSSKPVSVHSVPVEVDESTIRTNVSGLIHTPDTAGIDVTKADIIVAVGRGIEREANIQLVRDLADALGGVVACSRPVADYGWLPQECHVGISGKTVAPKVYIACGISGASQHVSGMRDSRTIIAINKDQGAPIFQVAHCGVVGNLFEVLPTLIQEAKKAREGSQS